MKRKASLIEGSPQPDLESTLPKDNAGIDETECLTRSETSFKGKKNKSKRKASLIEGSPQPDLESTLPKDNAGIDETECLTRSETSIKGKKNKSKRKASLIEGSPQPDLESTLPKDNAGIDETECLTRSETSFKGKKNKSKRKASLIEGSPQPDVESTLPKDNAGIETKNLTKSEKKKLKKKIKLQTKEAENNGGIPLEITPTSPVKKMPTNVRRTFLKFLSQLRKDGLSEDKIMNYAAKRKEKLINLHSSKVTTPAKPGKSKSFEGINGSEERGQNKMYNQHTIIVRNLPVNCTKDKLLELFSECGKLMNVRLPVDHHTGKPKKFAFIAFYDDDGVHNAIDKLNNSQLDEQTIYVKKYNESPGVGGRGRGRGGFSGGGGRAGSDNKRGGGRAGSDNKRGGFGGRGRGRGGRGGR